MDEDGHDALEFAPSPFARSIRARTGRTVTVMTAAPTMACAFSGSMSPLHTPRKVPASPTRISDAGWRRTRRAPPRIRRRGPSIASLDRLVTPALHQPQQRIRIRPKFLQGLAINAGLADINSLTRLRPNARPGQPAHPAFTPAAARVGADDRDSFDLASFRQNRAQAAILSFAIQMSYCLWISCTVSGTILAERSQVKRIR